MTKCCCRNTEGNFIGNIPERNFIILLQDTHDIFIFLFCCFPFVFSPCVASLKGFEEVSREHVLDCILSTLHKGSNFSSWPGCFGKSKYFPMSTSERCFPFPCMGGMFSIVEQLRIEGGDAEIAGPIVLILIDFTWCILYFQFSNVLFSI